MGEIIASKDGHGHCVISALIFSPSTAAVEDDPNSTSTEVHIYMYIYTCTCIYVYEYM